MQAMNPGTPARRAAAWLLLQRRGSLLGSARSFFQSAASASYEQGSSSSSSSSSSSAFARHHDSSYGYGVPSDLCAAAAGLKHASTTTSFFNFSTGSMRQFSCRPVHMTVNSYAITSSCSQAVRLMSSIPAVAKTVEEPSSNGSSSSSSSQDLERSHYWGLVPRKTDQTKKDGTPWPWHCFKPSDTYTPDITIEVEKHYKPTAIIDKLAYRTVRVLRLLPKAFFRDKYGCHAMMLETVAAVPGMVGGMLLHFKSLRRFEESGGWIRTLLDEAENERMHLMTLIQVIKPTAFERLLVLAVQGAFFNCYFILYLLSPQLAHRFCGYLEEEAVESYTHFLNQIKDGTFPNGPAPPIAIDYWQLPQDATMKDVVTMIRADECHHRDLNHFAADIQKQGKQLRQEPAPIGFH